MVQKRNEAKRKSRGKAGNGRNDQVVRILQTVQYLNRVDGCDVYELSQHFGRTVRTVRRDLEALEQSGIPLKRAQAEDSARVRYSFDSGAVKALSSVLEASHFLALKMVMTEGTASRAHSGFLAALDELAGVIEAAVGPRGRDQLLAIDRCFFSIDRFAWREAPKDVVLPLTAAIANSNLVEVTYMAPSSGNEEKTYQVLPLRLFVHHGSLYLLAWYEKFKQALVLNLHRLTDLKLTGKRVAAPEGLDLDSLMSSAFGIFIGPRPVDFELRFDAFARPYIEERRWHDTQVLTPQPDGGVTLTFRCVPSYEVTNWVASWREHVEVVKPASVRQEFARYGALLAERYKG